MHLVDVNENETGPLERFGLASQARRRWTSQSEVMDTKTDSRIGVWPTPIYKDGQAALKFLTEGLGFTLVAQYAGVAEGSIAHAELAWPAGGGVMVSSIDRNTEPNEFDKFADQAQAVYLVHNDPDALWPKCWRRVRP